MVQIPSIAEDADSQQPVRPLRFGNRSEKGSGTLNSSFAKQVEPLVDNKRRLDRSKAVLPVRILGNDVSGHSYSDLVHTLDVSKAGVRLGAVHRQLAVGSVIVIQYRQHKAEFRVVWIKPLGAGAEQQIGLEADAQRDLWGLDTDTKSRPQAAAAPGNHASIGA
jgi:hypothetical protein